MSAPEREQLYIGVDSDVPVARDSQTRRIVRYLGGAAGAAGLVALGSALAFHHSHGGLAGARARLAGRTVLADELEGSCEIPEKWCHENPQRRDRLTYRDCDGDGILDPYCEGGELLRFGYIGSKGGCKDNWPNGLCSRDVEATAGSASTPDQAAPNEITIIHFNDVYNVAGVLEGDTRSGGMSRAVHLVKKERERNPNRTFVVFAGDGLSPSVLSDLFEGAQMIDILNSFQLDAACLGNHEFDFGIDVLHKRLNESQFPWLNINLQDENGKLLEHTTQYFMRDIPWSPRWPMPGQKAKPTVKVCFFGVAYDVRETMFKDVDRIKYQDVFETSEKAAKHLKEDKGCNVVIPLTHQFSKEDCTLSKKLGKNADLILGGHDHTTEYTSVCGHAPYAKAASDLKTQWIMTLWLSDAGQVESVDARLVSLTDSDPFDVDMHARIVEWEEKGEKEMGKTVGCLDTPLDARNTFVRNEETNMGDFFTDAVRKMHHTDVALVNGGTMRGDKIYKSGELAKKNVVEMHPFGNAVAKVYATGKEIKDYINLQLACWDSQCGNFVQLSGMRYEFDSRKPEGHRLVKLMLDDGSEVDETKNFTVAITDYMLSNSKMKNNKLYNMVTLNDAVPIVTALIAAVKAANSTGKCIEMKTDGRITNLGED